MVKKFFSFILGLTILFSIGCTNINSDSTEATDKLKVQNTITNYYSNLGYPLDKIKICKIKQYQSGYLALVWTMGEGSQITLFKLNKNNGIFSIMQKVVTEPAISLGFAINRVVDGDNAILFSNLNEETWIPPDGKERIKTDYQTMVVQLENRTQKENIKGNFGYIVILDSQSTIKDVKFLNSKNEISNSLKDLINYGSNIIDIEFY